MGFCRSGPTTVQCPRRNAKTLGNLGHRDIHEPGVLNLSNGQILFCLKPWTARQRRFFIQFNLQVGTKYSVLNGGYASRFFQRFIQHIKRRVDTSCFIINPPTERFYNTSPPLLYLVVCERQWRSSCAFLRLQQLKLSVQGILPNGYVLKFLFGKGIGLSLYFPLLTNFPGGRKCVSWYHVSI